MAEKRIQPKAAGTESVATKTAAAGVEKMSLKRHSHKKTAKKIGLKKH